MDARMSVLTLGAQDVLAMKQFYTQVLGWPVLAENNDIVFFKLNGFLLSICNKKSLSEFIGFDFNAAVFHPLTIGYNVASKEAVQSLYDSLKKK
jgi:catechol-2,3-dioxygenase